MTTIKEKNLLSSTQIDALSRKKVFHTLITIFLNEKVNPIRSMQAQGQRCPGAQRWPKVMPQEQKAFLILIQGFNWGHNILRPKLSKNLPQVSENPQALQRRRQVAKQTKSCSEVCAQSKVRRPTHQKTNLLWMKKAKSSVGGKQSTTQPK
jgi:hypothetical protein